MMRLRSWLLMAWMVGLAACAGEAGEPREASLPEPPDNAAPREETSVARPQVFFAETRVVSPPLRDIVVVPPFPVMGERPNLVLPALPEQPTVVDPVAQLQQLGPRAPAPLLNLDGMGTGFTGPSFEGGFNTTSNPPDPVGDVGRDHYVQFVNRAISIFDKRTGQVLQGPVPTRSLWATRSIRCATENAGDGIVRYDRNADRWLILEATFEAPFYVCIAVSETSDPTGSYVFFELGFERLPDYPKLGIWPDAYYLTVNVGNQDGTAIESSRVCAIERTQMLSSSGGRPRFQCFDISGWFSLLPSDLDGPTPPPPGSPNYIFSLGGSSINMWRLYVDWQNTANSALRLSSSAGIKGLMPFNRLCAGGAACVPQPGTTQRLDALGERLMNRAPYRNYGSHASVLLTHSVTVGSRGGMRWYEIRDLTSTPTVYQQGTYAPDEAFRWMGSIASDRAGNIALGYAISSSTLFPGVRYTGRLVTDPLGIMGLTEELLANGGGSRLPTPNRPRLSERYGDYSSMNIDPMDDCTFWYTQEYLARNATSEWQTRIGSFRLPNCLRETIPPAVHITAPAAGSVLKGTILIQADATDNVAVARVEFYVDGFLLGRDSAPPYSVDWNTTQFTNGRHVLRVTAYDESGNATRSEPVLVDTENPGAGDIVNGGFEQGLSGWLRGGDQPFLSSDAHGGSSSLLLRNAGGTSFVTQSFGAPVLGGTLSLWFRELNCVRSTAWDTSGGAELFDEVTNVSYYVLLPECDNPGPRWTPVTFDLTPVKGHRVTLLLANTATFQGTLAFFDDVRITPILNGGFEEGFFGWSVGGTVLDTGARTGKQAARLGVPTSRTQNSVLQQTFVVPQDGGLLSFGYKMTCPDTVTDDWLEVTIRDNTTRNTYTVLERTCVTNADWANVTYDLRALAGRSVSLMMVNHDDLNPNDRSSTLIDDVYIQ